MLPPDGLAYAFSRSAELVAHVLGGGNLTGAFEHMQQHHREWPDAIRGAVRDFAWSTLRDYGRGDAVLRTLLHKPLPTELHALLLVALHRLETRPEQAHTLVDQAVEAAGALAPGLKGVVNGVLRARLRDAARLDALLASDEAARHRHPQWWIDRVRNGYPQRWEAVLDAGNRRPPMALRVNQRKATVDDIGAALEHQGIGFRRLDNDALVLERPLAVGRLPGFADGRLSVQDAGAQWAARWLDLAPGHRVLDACAAPGGKAAHILERADADLLALELDPQRVQRIRDNFERLGLSADVVRADARNRDEWWDGRAFDRILADVPCSASGVVRRHPDIKWLRRADDIPRFAAQQAQILDALWPTLAPGGKLLYVTCSIFHDENLGQIERFLTRHADVQLVELAGERTRQLLPNADHDGFFYALLLKRP